VSKKRIIGLLLGGFAAGCAVEENDVVLPAAPSVAATASVDPGLVSDCGDAEYPVGRLRGLVYTIPVETRALPDYRAMSPQGTICLDRLAVSARRGYPGFPGVRNRYEWFGVALEGTFQVAEEGAFRFRVTSDDGARVFIDDTLVIDDDGYHAARAAEGVVRLTAGPHRIAVPYWQGPGPMELGLEVARPGEPYRVFQLGQAL
jgi:hypothetical protein